MFAGQSKKPTTPAEQEQIKQQVRENIPSQVFKQIVDLVGTFDIADVFKQILEKIAQDEKAEATATETDFTRTAALSVSTVPVLNEQQVAELANWEKKHDQDAKASETLKTQLKQLDNHLALKKLFD